MKTAFLLGAGASKGAGLPLTDEITGKVLNDEFDILKSGNNPPYQPADLKSTSQNMTQSVLPFLRWIKVQVGCAGTSDNSVLNYEDFAYMAAQIRDHLQGEFYNPAVHPLIEKALSDVWPLLSINLEPCLEHLKRIADETVRYITNAVVQAVSNHATDFSYFRFLTDVPARCNEGALNIFTLNNDILVEQFLSKNGKRFIDGFDPPFPADGNWKPAVFEQNPVADTIRLFKLHGSVNWWRYHRPARSRCYKFLRIGHDSASRRSKQTIDPRSTPDGSPEILIGNRRMNQVFTTWVSSA